MVAMFATLAADAPMYPDCVISNAVEERLAAWQMEPSASGAPMTAERP